MKKNITWVVRILIVGLFLLSGLAKMFPHLWQFEKQIVDLGIANWCQSPYIARGIIGLEIAIAFALLQSHFLKRIIIPCTVLLLIAFCIHLGIQMVQFGPNNGNCGCFGQLIPMTPLEAFIKNIITIGLLIYLYRNVNEKERGQNNIIYPLCIFLASELLLFACFPFAPCAKAKTTATIVAPMVNTDSISISNIEQVADTSGTNPATTAASNITVVNAKDSIIINKKNIKDTITKSVNASKQNAIVIEKGPAQTQSRFAAYTNFSGKNISTDAGKKIICMFAPGCEHCQATAKEICGMRGKDFPEVMIFFMDEETEKIPDFFKAAGCNFPYQVVDIPTFWTLLGNGTTPGVNALWNGNIIKSWEGIEAHKFVMSDLKTSFSIK
jgi:hypothetical protein